LEEISWVNFYKRLILLVLGNQDWPNPFIPLCKFKLDKTITLLLLLSFMPLVQYLLPEAFYGDPGDRIHPLTIAFAVSLRSHSYLLLLSVFAGVRKAFYPRFLCTLFGIPVFSSQLYFQGDIDTGAPRFWNDMVKMDCIRETCKYFRADERE
jgi:hypothetical protein